MTDLTDADRKLAFEFVELFMSVEWALKQTDFLKSRRPDDRAKPDWKTFAGSLQGRLVRSPQIAEARMYLMAHPPMEQRIDSQGGLGWKTVRRDQDDEWYVLNLVRTVRNNLFHGGKYAAPVGPIGEPARDRPLLEASIVVLRACIELSPALKRRLEERS